MRTTLGVVADRPAAAAAGCAWWRCEALAAGGLWGGKACSTSGLTALAGPKSFGGLTATDRLLEDGTLDARQHAAALAYAALRRRYERSGGPMRFWRDRSGLSDEAWQAVKRNHARLLRAAGAERFVLDRLCLDDNAPLSSEVERVRAALGRVGISHPTYREPAR